MKNREPKKSKGQKKSIYKKPLSPFRSKRKPKRSVGTIKDFKATFGSGIATLILDVDGYGLQAISCENGPTVRILDDMFPGFITPGHTVDPQVVKDQRVAFE